MNSSALHKRLIILLTILCASALGHAQTVLINGVAKLKNSGNHEGIQIEFSRTAPTPLLQVFTTNASGDFSGLLPVGIYNITYKKTGYFSHNDNTVNCFTAPTLNEIFLHPRETQIHIPEVFQLIQHAIDDANHGDTIIIDPGIYRENINLKGKHITLTSLFLFSQDTSHISSTILDGKNEKSVIVCSSGENSQTLITGLTIRHGRATGDYPNYFGGGIRCEWSSPTLTHLNIENNYANAGGGGIYLHNSSSQISFVKLIGNSTDNDGGGIRITSSFVTIKNSIIANNSANSRGGGIACTYFNYVGDAEVINSTIVNNSVASTSGPNDQFNGGAGIKAYGHNLRLKNSIVEANRGDYGISYYQFSGSDSYPFISYSLFWENQYGNFYACDPLCGPLITENINKTPVDAFFNVYRNPEFKGGDNRFSLIATSAAVDGGYNDFVDLETDIHLSPRIQNNKNFIEPQVNMGATESVAGIKPEVTFDETNCLQDPVTITISSTGNQFKWFRSPNENDYLGQSSNLLTLDTLTKSITLYIAQADHSVLSEFTPVAIQIYSTPDFSLENTPVNPTAYQFSASSTKDITNYLWTVTNTPLISEVESPVFEFPMTGTFEVCLQATNPGCEILQCNDFELVITDLSEGKTTREFELFPNPVTHRFIIRNPRGNEFSFDIVNSAGSRLESRQNSSTYEVITDQLTDGIYFLIIKPSASSKKEMVYKIVKSGN